ncbi:MAG TPA: Secreted glycosyl hydrolase, partial [Polyangia bacterium]|nr:Secreted glycosyl hydrolase [Polyangia bacterium]
MVFSLAGLIVVGCSAGGVVSTGSAGQPGTSGSAGAAGAGTAGASGVAGTASAGAAGMTTTSGAAGRITGTAGQTSGAAGANPDGGVMTDAGTFYDVPPPPMATRGATVPWIEYEAESASTNGVAVGPDRTFGTIASESSGRRAVRLEQMGQFVELTSTQRANAIVVRYVIPDAGGGGGTTATLDLSIDGVAKTPLMLTSKYAWSYGGEASTSNDPSQGGAHHFYDEVHALVGDIAPGA